MEGTAIEPYACCGSIHSSIDATLQLARDQDLRSSDAASIELLNSSLVADQCFYEYTGDGGALEAQMNLQYCLAVALIDGEVFTNQFTDERIARGAVSEVAQRVGFEVDSEIEAIYPQSYPARVRTTSTTDQSYEAHVSGPTGSSFSPYGWPELDVKFSAITRDVIGETNASNLLSLVKGLEHEASVDGLTRWGRPRSTSAQLTLGAACAAPR